MTALVVGDLTFIVRRSDRRRTLGLTVERDGSLVLSAPPSVETPRLERFVTEKRFWIYQKLAAKDALPPRVTRRYVSGEGFDYLGRSHRLLLVSVQDGPLKLSGGRFCLRRADAPDGRVHFVRWYLEHGQPWLRRRVRRWAPHFRIAHPEVAVRDLGYRWASHSRDGRLNFHWACMLLPVRGIDYLIVHELAHAEHPDHSPAFWRAVERVMPDYDERKTWLAAHGHRHEEL